MIGEKVVCMLVAGAMLSFLSSCTTTSPNSSPLVGRWNMTQQINSHSSRSDTLNASASAENMYVFNSDYSFSGTGNLYGGSFSYSGTWSVKGDSVTLAFSGSITETWYFSVSGSTLTMKRSIGMGTGMKLTTEYYAKQ